MIRINKKLCLTVIMAVFILVSASYVFADEPVQPSENCATPFNATEIIERVSHHPIMEGNTIVIKDRVYEAFFNEHGVVLKAREIKQDAEDLIIPVTGRPEIQDGKVVYQTEYGEITFVGTSQGIRFEQTNQLPKINSPISNYSGNIARLENEKITEWSREGEFLIDTSIVYSSVPGWQYSPSIAYDGINYLVVWHDLRSGSADIYGTRVDQSGTVLDPTGIAISTAADWQEDPSVAFDGTDYLVVWRDRRSGNDIYGARVTQSGTVLDPNGIAISTAANVQWYPAVAFDGANFLVVWEDDRNGNYDIYGTRVNRSGNVIDTLGIEISIADSYQIAPAVSFCDSTFLVVWYDGRNTSHDIYGARVTPSGTVLDQSGIAISTAVNNQQYPSVASDGTNYFVMWHDYRNGGDIYGARVTQSGTVLDPTGIAISTAVDEQTHPAVTFNGTNYMVAWCDWRNGLQYYVCGARVTQSGTVLDPSGIAISTGSGAYPSVASNGTNSLVVWQNNDIYGSRVSQSGTVLDTAGIHISIVVNYQWGPSVAFDGTNYLVVWEDERSGYYYDIYGARVDQSGNVLDPSGIAISTATDMQRHVSVTFGGSNYLVVWEDERNYPDIEICGARLNLSGTVLDPLGIHIATALTDENRPHPSVAFDGTNYLVAWEEATIYPYLDIYGVFVNQSGNVLGPSFCISNATDYQWHPSVAFDGTNYLVVWQDNRSGVTDIYGARVDQSGNVLNPSGIAISTATDYQWYPSVTYDGTNYFIVWEDWRNGGLNNSDIYGARVDQYGIVFDTSGIAISTAQDNQKNPVTSWDGTDYVIVWHDFRSYTEWDIYGAKVNTSGVIVNSFPVSLQLGDQIAPALVHGTGDQILITYSGWTGTVNGKSYHAMRIWGKFYPFTGIEENTLRSTPYAIRLQVYPNPITKQCNIKYTLPQNTNVHISLFDATGRVVKEIINARQNAGKHQKTIDMSNLSQGMYFIRIETDMHSQTEKVIYLK